MEHSNWQRRDQTHWSLDVNSSTQENGWIVIAEISQQNEREPIKANSTHSISV